jgi:antirestriction protein
MKKLKEIALPNSNLYLYGWGTDTNGNNVIKVGFPNRKGFSIQTNGILPFSNSTKNTSLSDLTETDIEKIEKEVVAYITVFGSKSQKSVIKKYATGGGVKKSTDGIKGYEDLYGEDVKKSYYQKKKQAEEKQPKMVRTMFEDEQYEYKTGGKLEDEPRVYIADLAAYNDGKLVGEWINLSDYNDGSEVMEKIDELLKKWSKKAGEEREEYAVHDYENFSANLYSEYMSEESFDKVIKSYNVSKTTGIPADVIATIVREYNPDDIEEWINEHYEGEFNNDTDLAYHYVEKLGGVKELGEKTTDMYFDYESFGRDLSINDFNDYDGHYFRSYAKGGDIKKHDLTKYVFKNMSCYSIGGL